MTWKVLVLEKGLGMLQNIKYEKKTDELYHSIKSSAHGIGRSNLGNIQTVQ